MLSSSAEIIKRASSGQHLIAGYVPQNDLTAVAVALYGIVCIIFWMHWFRQGKQRWMLALVIGNTCMLIGFFGRIGCHYNPYSLGIYVFSTLFILLSPCAFLAADYVTLSSLSRYLGADVTQNCLIFPATLIVKFFVISDIFTFTVQAAGGAMTASGQTNPSMGNIGQKVSMAGLSLQGASFAGFTIILLTFGYKVRKMYPQKWSMSEHHPDAQSPHKSLFNIFDTTPILDWRILYYTVCATCIGLLTRSGFRIAEFAGGYTGHIYVTEGYFYGLDALPIWLAISLYVFVWPPRFLKHKYLFDGEKDIALQIPGPASSVEENSSVKMNAL